jgi:hypothetical protein
MVFSKLEHYLGKRLFIKKNNYGKHREFKLQQIISSSGTKNFLRKGGRIVRRK